MCETAGRKYAFTWDLIGDIDEGRPNLGQYARLETYRLMQYTFRDALEQECGAEKTDKIFYNAGEIAGKAFYKNMMKKPDDLDSFVSESQEVLKTMSIGILRVEEADMEQGRLVLTVSEDLDCSGLPDVDDTACTWDEGFIAGLLESYTHKPFKVKEIDCWCTGDRTCRFVAEVNED